MNRRAYSSDLTDEEWALLAPMIPPARSGGRPRATEMREICNAIFYITRGGCARRLLPHEFPKWQTIYHYYRRSRLPGLWARMHRRLRDRLRQLAGRTERPANEAKGDCRWISIMGQSDGDIQAM